MKKNIIKLSFTFFILLITIIYILKVIKNRNEYNNMKKKFSTTEKILLLYKKIKGPEKNFVKLLKSAKKNIYDKKNTIELFELITALSEKEQVNLISFMPDKNNKKFKLLIRGKYLSILEFIENLEKSRFLINLTGFRIYVINTQTGIVEADIDCKLL